LTNRIDNNLKNRHGKLFFRNDQSIDKGVEALIMANYSVFYYLARSCTIVASEPHLFPEDVFIFLRATTENIAKFLDTFTNRLAERLNINKGEVPKWTDIKKSGPAENILKYRDAFVHSARLGRHPSLSREFIPNSSHISKARHYWRDVQNLPEDQFVDSRKYLKELQKDLMKEINPVWKVITQLLDDRRTSKVYLKFYRLEQDASGNFRPIKWADPGTTIGPSVSPGLAPAWQAPPPT
jgi:hypothetical protein